MYINVSNLNLWDWEKRLSLISLKLKDWDIKTKSPNLAKIRKVRSGHLLFVGNDGMERLCSAFDGKVTRGEIKTQNKLGTLCANEYRTLTK